VQDDRSGGIQLADPLRQSRERDVDRSRKVSAPPFVGAANVNYLDTPIARRLPELGSIELTNLLQVSVR